MAPLGLNTFAHTLLEKPLALQGTQEVLEPSWTDGRGFGWIDTSARTWTPQTLAQTLQTAFGEVRYSAAERSIRKIAYCSGSAASMLELAAAKGCDALITGDIKHDRWYAAEFAGIALFDCGHYGTERFAAGILAEQIRKALPAAQVTENAGRNPAEFCRSGKSMSVWKCPVCGSFMQHRGKSWSCAQGHNFDMAKSGYVNLLPVNRKHAKNPGTTP